MSTSTQRRLSTHCDNAAIDRQAVKDNEHSYGVMTNDKGIDMAFLRRKLCCVIALIVFLAGCILLYSAFSNLSEIRIEFTLGFNTQHDLHEDDDNAIAINRSYYSQWYGSSVIDKEWKTGSHNRCGIPSLIFVWNHKTGGYFKEWTRIFEAECAAPRLELSTLKESNNHSLYSPQNDKSRSHLNYHKLHQQHKKHLQRFNDWNEMQRNQNQNNHHSSKYKKRLDPMLKTKIKEMNKKWDQFMRSTNTLDEMVVIEIKETDPDTLKAATFVLQQNRPDLDYVVIYMIRKPMDVILSGYNYHASGHEMGWTDRPLSEIHNEIPLIDCFRNIWNPEEFVIDNDTTMYREYEKGYRNNYSDHEALQYGLYLEFTRFVNCEWPLQIAMYEEIKNDFDHRCKWFLFLRFEWFQEYNYEESAAYFAEQIIDSGPKPKQRIKRITTQLGWKDPNTLCEVQHMNRTCEHMTVGKYDRDLQVDLLMQYDERICGLLKNMTFRMDGKWEEMRKYC